MLPFAKKSRLTASFLFWSWISHTFTFTQAIGMREEIRRIFRQNSFCGLFETALQQDALNVELENLSDIAGTFTFFAASLEIKGFPKTEQKSLFSIPKKAARKLRVVAAFLDANNSPLCQSLKTSGTRSKDDSLPGTISHFQVLWSSTSRLQNPQTRAKRFVEQFFSKDLRCWYQITLQLNSVEMRNFHFPSKSSPIANSDFFSLISNRILFLQEPPNFTFPNELISSMLSETFLENYVQFFMQFCSKFHPKHQSDIFDWCINGLSGATNEGTRNETANWHLFLTPGLETAEALHACYLQALEMEQDEEFICFYLGLCLDGQISQEIFAHTRSCHWSKFNPDQMTWNEMSKALAKERFTQVHSSYVLVQVAMEMDIFKGLLKPQLLKDTLKSLLGAFSVSRLEANIGSVFGFGLSNLMASAIVPLWERYLRCTASEFEWSSKPFPEEDFNAALLQRLTEWINWNYYPFTLETLAERKQIVLRRLGDKCPDLALLVQQHNA